MPQTDLLKDIRSGGKRPFGRHPADVRDPVDEVNLRNGCQNMVSFFMKEGVPGVSVSERRGR